MTRVFVIVKLHGFTSHFGIIGSGIMYDCDGEGHGFGAEASQGYSYGAGGAGVGPEQGFAT